MPLLTLTLAVCISLELQHLKRWGCSTLTEVIEWASTPEIAERMA